MSQHEGRDKKGRKLLPIFLVLVLMVVIASSLFLVLRICGGTNTLNSASFEREENQACGRDSQSCYIKKR